MADMPIGPIQPNAARSGDLSAPGLPIGYIGTPQLAPEPCRLLDCR